MMNYVSKLLTLAFWLVVTWYLAPAIMIGLIIVVSLSAPFMVWASSRDVLRDKYSQRGLEWLRNFVLRTKNSARKAANRVPVTITQN